MSKYSLIFKYIKSGDSTRKIAKNIGVSHQTVHKYCVDNIGINYRKLFPLKPKRVENKCKKCGKIYQVLPSSKSKNCSRRCFKRTIEEKRTYHNEKIKEYLLTKEGKIKHKARSIVNNHLKQNKLIKPLKCNKCKLVKKLEAHHEDHLKPLEIIWCCKKCHRELEKLLKLK